MWVSRETIAARTERVTAGEFVSARYYRVHNAEKMTIKSPVSRSLCCAWVKLPRIIFSRGFFRSVMYIYIIYDVVLLAI